ncbi:ABC transporter ATP-binding protein [Pelagovum pacificum]|uniref:ABC transporter ATP-binding protein n=1 Tax=Pelagovum pacificum TaxID=2588711 RepID=A0A5C5G975_9RHOB|nr:ABC transporter ATP-binding protein [Pelagovum pacificum]QQA42179.1 ABC transporter ATP-binding protein [Pelagovum pacificum]TNY31265.1 ABC transporter ATP-binding protein [Pelagovum pacificum]
MADTTSTDVGPSDDPSERLFRRTNKVGGGLGLEALNRINRMMLRYPRRVAVAFVATLVAVALQLSIPVLLGRAVDETQALAANPDMGRGGLVTIALTLLLVSIGRGLFTMAQNYSAESVGHALAHDLRLSVYNKIQHLPFSFHDRTHSGDLITVGMLDLEGVRMYFSTALVRTLLLVLLIGVGAAMLLSMDFVLGLLALSFVPFAAWRSSVTQLTLRSTWIELQERLAVLSRVMEENLAGIRVVRAFSAANHELDKFDRASKTALDLSHDRVKIRVMNSSAMTLAFFTAMGLVLWVGGRKVAAGDMSVGTLATFLTFMTILQMPVRQLGLMVNAYARASTCGARLFLLLDMKVDVDTKPGAPDLEVTEGTLKLDDVSFAYESADGHRAIANVSFEAKRGETVGIVGAPGSGKTTLMHLIPRYYDVNHGSISIDGQDIRDVTLSSLRRAVAVVQQDSFLFTTTIENNIAYGNPRAQDRRIHGVSESAQLHDYVLRLPQGYRTVVGERGVSLSGGQRQRLSIARTLMLEPAVLIFDDSTAAIDAGTEGRIRSAMRNYAADRVTIIVAHRLNSLMHADQILFLEEGKVVEQGTHEELLALGGRYRALHDLQMRPEGDVLDEMEANQ